MMMMMMMISSNVYMRGSCLFSHLSNMAIFWYLRLLGHVSACACVSPFKTPHFRVATLARPPHADLTSTTSDQVLGGARLSQLPRLQGSFSTSGPSKIEFAHPCAANCPILRWCSRRFSSSTAGLWKEEDEKGCPTTKKANDMQKFKKQQKKGPLRRSHKNVPNKFDWGVLDQMNLCFAASLLSLSLDAWQFATFRVLILLPASNAMSKEVQPSWEKKQQNWVHGILGKLIVLKFNPQRIAPFLAPGKNFRYKDHKISLVYTPIAPRYQFHPVSTKKEKCIFQAQRHPQSHQDLCRKPVQDVPGSTTRIQTSTRLLTRWPTNWQVPKHLYRHHLPSTHLDMLSAWGTHVQKTHTRAARLASSEDCLARESSVSQPKFLAWNHLTWWDSFSTLVGPPKVACHQNKSRLVWVAALHDPRPSQLPWCHPSKPGRRRFP